MPDISSVQNPRIKYLVKLRDDRRQRQRDRLILVEGKYEIELALASGLHPEQVIHCKDLSHGNLLTGVDQVLTSVDRSVFEKISHREGPDGWLAVFPLPGLSIKNIELSPQPLLVLAQSVEKPGNLGAILRTADSAGVDGILVCDPRVEPYNPNVIRASRGTIFTVPAIETNSPAALDWLKTNRIKVLAATPQAEMNYTEVDLRQPVCIAVGTEDRGLSDFWLENSDLQVRIPMFGHVNSLNVSASTAIILYEVVRQRMAP